MLIGQVSSAILILAVNLRIKLYKRKNPVKKVFKYDRPKVKNVAFESSFFNVVLFMVTVEVTYVISRINATNLVENNLYPNYIFVNIFQLVNPVIIMGGGAAAYLFKNDSLRKGSVRESKQQIDCIF
jgi:hypothetical protein